MKKEEFIEKAKKKHTQQEINAFSYELIPEKITSKENALIYCHELDEYGNEHGLFSKRVDMFLFGDGCPKCRSQMSNTKEWINKAQKRHVKEDGTPKYDYSKSKYTGSQNNITVICHEKDELTGEEHGEFYPPARNHLFSTGCPKCAGNAKYTRESFIKRAQKIHTKEDGTPKYDYTETFINEQEYGNKQYVVVTCHEKDIFGVEHGDFTIRADAHLHKTGCPKCADSYKVSEQEFIKRAELITNNLRISKGLSTYDYTDIGFTKMNEMVFPICNEMDSNGKRHGRFEQLAYNHLSGREGCPKCQALMKSFPEYQLIEFIKNLIPDTEILLHSRSIINPYEIDIYIPSLKIAFEFNGLFYHNDDNVPINYHIMKTRLCEKQGIKLIHIWEDEWIEKQEIIKSRIKNLLLKNDKTIFARQCIIKEVSKTDERLFLESNHLQGYIVSKYCYGLYIKDTNELVSLISFGKSRYDKTYEYELYRFVNKQGITVIGGASKLFNHFVKQFEHVSIITYADRCWSSINSNVYQSILHMSFKLERPLSYFYYKNQTRYKRQNFMKHKLQDCPSNKTEKQYMKEQGYSIVYTPGNLVYEYIK